MSSVSARNRSATRLPNSLLHNASRGHDVWDRLAEISAPTLIIDAMTPPGSAEQMAAVIPGAELELPPGARHGYL